MVQRQLSGTGVVGRSTRLGVAVLCALAVWVLAGCGGDSPRARGLIDVGDTGTAVTAVQHLLNSHGHEVEVSGQYGPHTRAAMRDFQSAAGLEATGGVGARTMEALPPELAPGEAGHAVKAAQTLLGEHGHEVAVEGVLDGATMQALETFRRDQEVAPEPGVGAATWAALFTDLDIDGAPVTGTEQFFAAMAPYAKEAQREYGVPGEVTLAQACQETGCGKSAPGNNYFGIKCHGAAQCASQQTFEYEDGQKVEQQASFRSYDSMEESVVDYARFLSGNPRYAEAFATRNPSDFARALHKAGYATDPHYADQLIALMEQHRLSQLV